MPALVKGNGGNGTCRTAVVGQDMGIGVASFGAISGGVVAVEGLGRIVGRRIFVAVGGGSRAGGKGADQGWDCDAERDGWTGITS